MCELNSLCLELEFSFPKSSFFLKDENKLKPMTRPPPAIPELTIKFLLFNLFDFNDSIQLNYLFFFEASTIAFSILL